MTALVLRRMALAGRHARRRPRPPAWPTTAALRRRAARRMPAAPQG